MLGVSSPGVNHKQRMMVMNGGVNASSRAMPAPAPVVMASLGTCGRYEFDGRKGCWSVYGKGKMNNLTATTRIAALEKRRMSISPACSALAEPRNLSRASFYKEVLEAAREKFTQEISIQSKDKDISLAKALLYVAVEDEAFLAFNREIDALSLHNERRDTPSPSNVKEWDCMEAVPLAGKNICEWLVELDAIAKEVEAEIVSRDIGCDLVEVIDAVNKVLFESRGFKRSSVLVDSKCLYLHSVLSSGCASAILVSVIYIEVCRRLNLTIVGSRIGGEFFIWPLTGNPEELFKVTSGHSLFGAVNGKCVEDLRSMASDINSNSLLGLDIATNRDIIGVVLCNLIRLHWKQASRTNYGLMLVSPLRSVHKVDQKFNKKDGSDVPLLRPQELRLAIMASERLLILQPHNWVFRRDYGMMLYYSRDYEAAVQQLSICMAFAPEEEAEVLDPFVGKLHLMRLESSWKSPGQQGRLIVP
ncbi:uncharacterized protein LOC111398598 isoform X1 [Olea europaea var. sylvestris]|uniref:uncharacterized protein LOC111398598 isoform X1 n=1 Tax=Olea europaea var. sylvestris TaxID=158386 RepID=UPI000C1D2170|nr:uncharacterized protein LOC111398598 isoform X1 [Olea europaea var. sylvestris]